jgi:hypothetical protein
MKLKELYNQMNEKDFLAMLKEKSDEDLPDELLKIIRPGSKCKRMAFRLNMMRAASSLSLSDSPSRGTG